MTPTPSAVERAKVEEWAKIIEHRCRGNSKTSTSTRVRGTYGQRIKDISAVLERALDAVRREAEREFAERLDDLAIRATEFAEAVKGHAVELRAAAHPTTGEGEGR